MLKKLLLCFAGVFLLIQFATAATTATAITGTGDYVVKVKHPAYAPNSGPRILVDDSHYNYSTPENRFKGFVDLMAADGARVTALHTPITARILAKTDIFVTCNPLNKLNSEHNWSLPTPSAFTDDEIKAVQEWVRGGGSMLLISDHMPFPSATAKLAGVFGAIPQNTFVFKPDFQYGNPKDMNLLKFMRYPDNENVSLLRHHIITNGRNKSERIPYVTDFTGHAFRMKAGVKFSPIMVLRKNTNMLWPSVADTMGPKTPSSAGEGFFQGVVLGYGDGRVGLFAEAAMFSVAYADWNNNYPMGFQNPEAKFNQQFILNLTHWLNRDMNCHSQHNMK